jgi:ABC-2 type transport system permease protein
MSSSGYFSVARFVAWRNIRVVIRTPALLLPTVLFPLFFLLAFAGALSSISKVLGGQNYTAFQFVFALLQAAGFTGAMGGFAMAEDFESGFMPRLMVTAPHRTAILTGYTIGILGRGVIAAAALTAAGFILGMHLDGSALEIVAMFALAALLTLATTLWSLAVALHIRSFKAAPFMALPIFLLLFLTPVFVPLSQLTGWLHTVAAKNPFTPVVEAGRGFISGDPTDVALSFGILGGITAFVILFALHGMRRAEAAGGAP